MPNAIRIFIINVNNIIPTFILTLRLYTIYIALNSLENKLNWKNNTM